MSDVKDVSNSIEKEKYILHIVFLQGTSKLSKMYNTALGDIEKYTAYPHYLNATNVYDV